MALSAFSVSAVDDSGSVIPLAEVEVRRASDGVLAGLFSDASGLTGIANPLVAGLDGQVDFFTAPDRYTVQVTGGGGEKTYTVDLIGGFIEVIKALGQPIVLRGTFDASGGVFPGGGAAQTGDVWVAAVGGTIDSVAIAAGDRLMALVDDAATGTYAGNWFKETYSSAVISVGGRTGDVVLGNADLPAMPAQTFKARSGATSGVQQDVTPDTAREMLDVDRVASMTEEGLSVVNADGFALLDVGPDGVLRVAEMQVGGRLLRPDEGDGLLVVNADGFGVQVVDEAGVSQLAAVGFDGTVVEGDDSAGVYIVNADGFAIDLSDGSYQAAVNDLATRNARNLAQSAAVARRQLTYLPRLSAGLSHILWYGQSLSTGQESWPTLTKTTRAGLGVYMIGDSTRPDTKVSADFTPLGTSQLNAIKAVAQNAGFTALLDDTAQAALTPGDNVPGEEPSVAAAVMLRELFLDRVALDADPAREIVVSSCGVGGQTIAALSRGASPDLFNRLVDAATLGKGFATAGGDSYAVPAICWMQGEQDIGVTDKATYKAAFLALKSDVETYIADAIAGQSRAPAWFTYQTKPLPYSDTVGLAIASAQSELAAETAGVFLVGPTYPVTDKGVHLDANGSRWFGCQVGKVMHRVLTLGQDWTPLSPIAATITESRVLIDFHVPEPPLAFDTPYLLQAATDYLHRGFRVFDDGTEVDISHVSIVTDTVVAIDLVDLPTGTVTVLYAGGTDYSGHGCLRDSDPAVAPYNYEYSIGDGHYTEANIAALVDLPYPLHNWCIHFHLTATEQ